MFDFDDAILDFWRHSLRNDFTGFDFEEFFDEFGQVLYRRLMEHGFIGDLSEYRQYMEDIYGDLTDEIPGWGPVETDFTWFSRDEIVDIILERQREAYKNSLGYHYNDLVNLYERVSSFSPSMLLPESIALLDECIHAQHLTGDILEDVDIESLREEAESEWRDEQEELQSERVSVATIRSSEEYI